jgi:hypothetical protein
VSESYYQVQAAANLIRQRPRKLRKKEKDFLTEEEGRSERKLAETQRRLKEVDEELKKVVLSRSYCETLTASLV